MILITGATSFIGRAVVRRAVAEGCKVCCVLRPSRREQQLPVGVPFSTITASLNDLPALRTAMHDVGAIIHLAGEEDIARGQLPLSHIENTRNILAAAEEVGIRRFIYLSYLGADRASAYPVFRTLGEVEALLSASGLDYTIIQTSLVYGREDSFTNTVVMLSKVIPFIMPIPDAGLAHFQPLWVEDLARCIVATVDMDHLIRQTVPLGGPEHFNFRQMVTEILSAAGVRRRLINVRMPFMRAAIALCDTLLPHTPTPDWWLDLLNAGSATDLLSVPRHFGFEPHRFVLALDYLARARPWRREFLRFMLTRA